MAQYTSPEFNSYDDNMTLEENKERNAVVTKDIMVNIGKALERATAGTNISVVTGDTPGGNVVEAEDGTKNINITVPVGKSGSSVHASTEAIEEDATVAIDTLSNASSIAVNDIVIDATGNVYTIETVSETEVTVGGKVASIKGTQGDKGEKGDPFAVATTYESVEAMNAGYATDGVAIGSFVLIVSNVEDEDNAKMYVKGQSEYVFVVDLSGATGIKGDQGDKGDKGDKGDAGQAATITIGSVTTGDEASVINSGTAQNAVLDFVLPIAGKSKQLTVTLSSTGWVDNAQNATIDGMTVDDNCIISIPDTATTAESSAIYAAQLTIAQIENGLTFTVKGTVPSIDIPIQVIVLP